MHICNVRSQVFFPGVWVCLRDFILFLFFCSLEREPSLWENTWPWEILRIWESFPGIRLGNQDLWGGEKESTFDTGRRVETGTYHWEGRKPFIQTFDFSPQNCVGFLFLDLHRPCCPPPPPPPPLRLSSHTIFHQHFVTHHLSHTSLSHTHFCHTTSFSHHLSPTLCNTPSLSHTIFHTIFHTHTHPCHTQHLSHTIFHQRFVTHHLCHTPSSFTNTASSQTGDSVHRRASKRTRDNARR